MMNFKKLFLFMMVALATLGAASLYAWEEPVRIAGGDGNRYDRPAIKFGPSGKAYIVYQTQVVATGRNDILFRSYDGERLSAVTVLTAGNPFLVTPWWPDIAVTRNEELHVAWVEHNRSDISPSRYVKYRYFNGQNWAPIELLATIAGSTLCEDVRIAADSSNNVFVVVWNKTRNSCLVISKYFGKNPTIDFPVVGTSKHADIVCDDNFVHIAWQHKMVPDYGILYAKKANKENSRWQATVNLETYGTQRPRLDLDNDGNPFIAYWEDRVSDRRVWLRKWDAKLGLTNRAASILLSSAEYALYHYLDFSIKNNSMFCSWQKGDYFTGWGGSIFNAYKKSNTDTWVTDLQVPNTVSPALVASDQTWDGLVAGIAASTGAMGVTLYLSDRMSVNNPPAAVISVDKDNIFWDEEVVFNGSNSSDSDGTIVKYEWLISRDKVTLTGSSVTYRFNKKFGAMNVRLTVTDNKGGQSFTEKTITVKALFTPRSTATKQQIKTLLYNREGYVITWEPNTKNEQAGYNIVKYKIFRKEVGGVYQEIGEVTIDKKLIYADVTVETGKTYIYAISAVDDQDHKSPLNNF